MSWPAPLAAPPLVPLFLPFRGCPVRCIFCAQTLQTGQGRAEHAPLPQLLQEARQRLEQRALRQQPPAELAFYGGTFTALPEQERLLCLDFARELQAEGLICTFRCSTRPDCVDAAILQELRAAGCSTVELGIQSFDSAALTLARRGYDRATALRACQQVLAAPLRLGVQLLPGMPGSSVPIFLNDVKTALAAGAQLLRYYPCLVLQGTALAQMWQEGRFTPWDLESTLQALARAWLLARSAQVPVIRMGLAPEPGLAAAILAGPQHPALGGRVMGRALLLAVEGLLQTKAAGRGVAALEVPQFCQGYFWGHQHELRPRWAALGLEAQKLHYSHGAEIVLWPEIQ